MLFHMNTPFTGFAATARALAAACILLVGLAACESKITKTNYDQVQTGMTKVEVEKLLGSGTLDEQPAGVSISSSGVGDVANASKDQTYTWKDKGVQVIITFTDGKVVQKRQTGL
jgi:hypothetical protein